MVLWRITTISYKKEHSGKSDVVYSVGYDCVDKKRIGDWEPEGMVTDALEFDTSNLDDFVEYDDLTEEIVIGWLKGALGDAKVAEIEAEALAKLEEKLNPTSETVDVFPWQ